MDEDRVEQDVEGRQFPPRIAETRQHRHEYVDHLSTLLTYGIHRVTSWSAVTIGRKVMKDVTLSDGTFLPAGAMVQSATYPLHHDDAIYPSANTFDPFRFSRMREAEGESVKHQIVTTSNDNIAFGHGKHAWYVLVP